MRSKYSFVAGCTLAIAAASATWSVTFISADNQNVRYFGRFDHSSAVAPQFNWPGSTIAIAMQGSGCKAILRQSLDSCSFNVIIDGAFVRYFLAHAGVDTYAVATGLTGSHQIMVSQRGESAEQAITFGGLVLDDGASLSALPAAASRRIEFIGDSHTAGAGARGTADWATCVYGVNDAWASYASIAARALNADANLIAVSGKGAVHNHSDSNQVSAVTMRQLCRRTLINNPASSWDFTSWTPQVVVINLGTNDFAECFQMAGEKWRKPATAAQFMPAYAGLLDSVRTLYPGTKIVIMGPYDQCGSLDSAQKVLRSVYNAQIGAGKTDIAWCAYPKFVNGDYVCCHPGTAYHQKLADSLSAVIRSIAGWNAGADKPVQPKNHKADPGARIKRGSFLPRWYDIHGKTLTRAALSGCVITAYAKDNAEYLRTIVMR